MESHTSCPVCHEGIDVYAVGCCDHVICYKCSCRMRVLCEQFYCPICRTDLPQVYLVKDDLKYGDIPRYGYIPNRKNKIFFQNEKVKGLFEKLQENCCQICTHARPERNFKDLQNHMRKEHTLFYCNLCIDHLKLFSSERKYYNRHDLALHRRQGDKDDSSYKGHPICQFCDERYMDNDELYRHLRQEHFFCHFCDPDGSREFYNDYASLRDHFRNKHFLCQEGACSGTEIRLTHAFRSRIDLQAHTTSEHGNNLTKAQAKQMRTIDIDYQFAPRERRRDRGVVIPTDYEDVGQVQTKVFHNSRGSRGHSGRQRYEESRGFKKGNFSEEDVQRAINASLDVMKEKEKVIVEEQPEVKEEEKVVRDAENFPVLGNMKQELADSTVDSDHKDSDSEALDFSMAKQIALKNKRSVQYGRLISEEFPTLSGEPSVRDTATNSSIDLTNKSITSTKSSQPISKKTESVNKPGKKFTTAISKGPVQAEDFPGLPTKSSGPNSALGSASWVSKQTTKKDNKQVSAMPVQVAINTTTNNNNNKTSKSTNKKVSKTFNDDHDFPSLGGQATASVNNMNWLQKSAVEKSKSKQEKKTVDWFDANDKFEFTMDNLKKQSESTEIDNKYTINSDTKKKKKKKEKVKTSENASQSNSKSKGEDTSLDSIASTLLSNKVETEMKQEWNKVDSPKNVRKEESSKIDCPKNDQIEEIKKPDSPQFLRKEGKNSDFVANLIEMDENKFSVLGDEEPDMKYMVERKPVSTPKKKDIEVKLDDFPTLGAANPHKAPPPGFAKPLPSTTVSSTPTNKPPGFDDVSTKRPPPGFSLPVSSQPNGHSTIAEKQCNFTLKNIMPMMSETSNFDYVPPQDSKSRNQKLIEAIMDYLSKNQDCFNQFKSVSAAFRNGSTSAKEYYSQCEKLIGKEHFDNIFPELLVLLPDIDKQQDLWTTYKEVQGQTSKSGRVIKMSGKSADAPWKQTANFQSCPTCRQVLLSCDISDHTSVHSNASDFPSLSGGGSGPGLRGWVKGN